MRPSAGILLKVLLNATLVDRTRRRYSPTGWSTWFVLSHWWQNRVNAPRILAHTVWWMGTEQHEPKWKRRPWL